MAKKKIEKDTISFFSWSFHILSAILFGILFLFLATNILFAVSLPDIDRVTRGKSEDVVHFMKQARMLRAFQVLFPEIRETFMAHEQEVYKDDHDRRIMITKLESALAINPKSRDVLYSLYLLYDKAGNEEKASIYYLQAKAIDPSIK
jgi:tetratricopeptide (TPR) repeat protein